MGEAAIRGKARGSKKKERASETLLAPDSLAAESCPRLWSALTRSGPVTASSLTQRCSVCLSRQAAPESYCSAAKGTCFRARSPEDLALTLP